MKVPFNNLKGRRVYQFVLDEKTGKIEDISDSFDYVKVVRCKDCKWHKPKYPGERPTCLIYLGDWHDDDYCSRAERKEE